MSTVGATVEIAASLEAHGGELLVAGARIASVLVAAPAVGAGVVAAIVSHRAVAGHAGGAAEHRLLGRPLFLVL